MKTPQGTTLGSQVSSGCAGFSWDEVELNYYSASSEEMRTKLYMMCIGKFVFVTCNMLEAAGTYANQIRLHNET